MCPKLTLHTELGYDSRFMLRLSLANLVVNIYLSVSEKINMLGLDSIEELVPFATFPV